MSKPDSNSSKVLISNPVIGFTIVTLIAGSLFYIYLIHAHLTHLQLYKSAIVKTLEAKERDKKSFRDQYLKFNHGLHTLSQASENFLQTSLENQALSQYTKCKSQTHQMWGLVSPAVDSGLAKIENLTWDSDELVFELHTLHEEKFFDQLNRAKSANPRFALHIDQVSHMSNESNGYSIILGRVTQDECMEGQS